MDDDVGPGALLEHLANRRYVAQRTRRGRGPERHYGGPTALGAETLERLGHGRFPIRAAGDVLAARAEELVQECIAGGPFGGGAVDDDVAVETGRGARGGGGAGVVRLDPAAGDDRVDMLGHQVRDHVP